jgi:hypothetical protein
MCTCSQYAVERIIYVSHMYITRLKLTQTTSQGKNHGQCGKRGRTRSISSQYPLKLHLIQFDGIELLRHA